MQESSAEERGRVDIRRAFRDVFKKPLRLALACVALTVIGFVPWAGWTLVLGYQLAFARAVLNSDDALLPGRPRVLDVAFEGVLLLAADLAGGIVFLAASYAVSQLLRFVAALVGSVFYFEVIANVWLVRAAAFTAVTAVGASCIASGNGWRTRLHLLDMARRARRHFRSFMLGPAVVFAHTALALLLGYLAGLAYGTRVLAAVDEAAGLLVAGQLTPTAVVAATLNVALFVLLAPLQLVFAHLLGQYARVAYHPENEHAADAGGQTALDA